MVGNNIVYLSLQVDLALRYSSRSRHRLLRLFEAKDRKNKQRTKGSYRTNKPQVMDVNSSLQCMYTYAKKTKQAQWNIGSTSTRHAPFFVQQGRYTHTSCVWNVAVPVCSGSSNIFFALFIASKLKLARSAIYMYATKINANYGKMAGISCSCWIVRHFIR